MKIKTVTPDQVKAGGLAPTESAQIEDARIAHVHAKEDIMSALHDLRRAYETVTSILDGLRDRLHDANVDDAELGFHELFFQEVENLCDEMRKLAKRKSEQNSERFLRVVLARGTDGIMTMGRQFVVNAELKPKMPSKDKEPEAYEETLNWVRDSQYSGIINEEIKWKAMKKIIEELATAGLPGPPNVKMYPDIKITIKKGKSQ